MGKYVVIVESDTPPRIYLDDTIPNVGRVIEIKSEKLPKTVGTSWLMERFDISRSTLIAKLRDFNIGGDGKHLYDPTTVIPILTQQTKTKRGPKRKN